MNTTRRFLKIKLAIVLLLFLSGCWDYKEIHHLTFVTTIGIDYKDDVFFVYVQALNFANIAQKEGLRPPSHSAVIGVGKGPTITDAMFDLYKSEQQRIFWGHISAMIVSEQALRRVSVEDLTDTINRYREIRYNIWVYGTSEPIEKLLEVTPNFGYSPYDSNLMKPDKTFNQFSAIEPVFLYQFIKHYFERGVTAMLPKLSYENSHWREGGKATEHLEISGAYFYSYKKLKGSLTREQLIGKRYLDEHALRVPITVFEKGKPVASIVLEPPDVHYKHRLENGEVYYDIRVRLNGYIDELYKDLKQETMTSLIENKVEKQIRETFNSGKKIKADVLNLNTPVYRFDFSGWKSHIFPNKDMENIHIDQITVKALIKYTGKYKGRID
ncbi:Ger(x)C family spore germination protein [Paenibacillus piri]|uniref:Ger(X)C family spore germination protein n=1 Tax=Paenibacillus piri TaxID=2547395 RepID=A0A4R5KZX0_9BACL|nr:Ger(x)C family spore germination protein [Paenibacillus piri]TDG00806.1 Ger(x)C family spore germination protein [Paenibacillus piri]